MHLKVKQFIITYWPALLCFFIVLAFFYRFISVQKNKFEQIPIQYSNNHQPVLSYANAVDKASIAVVNIFSKKVVKKKHNPLLDDPVLQHFFGIMPPKDQQRIKNSIGSGVLVSNEGYILTSNHVIDGANQIEVVLKDGRSVIAKVMGTDPSTDLAVLWIPLKNLTGITIGQADKSRTGDIVLAIGNPYGVGQTVTLGIISAVGRHHLGIANFENFIQTDAAINPGNSGGALVNTAGELIGINTAIFSKTGGSHGIGFAIPVDLAMNIMSQIVQQGRVIRGWVGIAAEELSRQKIHQLKLPIQAGVIVTSVLDRGAAFKAGIKVGDILTQVNDISPKNSFDILNLIANSIPGKKIVLGLYRNQQFIRLNVTVGERPKKY